MITNIIGALMSQHRPLPTRDDDEILTAAEVADWLRLSVEAVRRLHRARRLIAIDGYGHLRFSRAAVRRFIHG